jgi:peroxiredoxin
MDFQKGIQYIVDSGILDSAIQKGDIAPDFRLKNATGQPVTLSEILMDNPVVLIWYRGG